jgi:hypothetical protein
MLIMLPFKKREEKKYACMHAFESRRKEQDINIHTHTLEGRSGSWAGKA